MSIRVSVALACVAVCGVLPNGPAFAAGPAVGAPLVSPPAAVRASAAVMIVTPKLSSNGPGGTFTTPQLSSNGPGGTFTTPPLSSNGPRGSLDIPHVPIIFRKR